MLLNSLVFLVITTIAFFLYKFLKSISSDYEKKEKCKFKITTPRYKNFGQYRIANFDVIVLNHYTFFIDFPISFKFYSDYRFKTKVKIKYSTAGEKLEEIINKSVVFEKKTLEHVCYINDIIVGKIEIEIELNVEYGDPIIEFEILENKLCDLNKEYKLELKFPS